MGLFKFLKKRDSVPQGFSNTPSSQSDPFASAEAFPQDFAQQNLGSQQMPAAASGESEQQQDSFSETSQQQPAVPEPMEPAPFEPAVSEPSTQESFAEEGSSASDESVQQTDYSVPDFPDEMLEKKDEAPVPEVPEEIGKETPLWSIDEEPEKPPAQETDNEEQEETIEIKNDSHEDEVKERFDKEFKQEDFSAPIQAPQENSPNNSSLDTGNVVIRRTNNRMDIFVKKEDYQDVLVMIGTIGSHTRKAANHVNRAVDNERIVTAKLKDLLGILNDVQEKLMNIDSQIFEEGEIHG